MNEKKLEELTRWFEAYALSFAGADGKLPKASECKLVHTKEVLEAAKRIARSPQGAGLSGSAALLAETAALLHDVARFEQYRLHKTFSDRKSFDHGDAGAKMIGELKLVEGLALEEAKLVAEAVRLHNKAKLPEGLAPALKALAQVVRDADKAAIIDFIGRYLNEEAERWKDPAISFEMPDSPGFDASIAESVLKGEIVDYRRIKCVNDFLIAIFAWPCDICYAETARMILEKGLYHKIGPHLPPSPLLDEMMDASSSRLLKTAGFEA